MIQDVFSDETPSRKEIMLRIWEYAQYSFNEKHKMCEW